jgi:class 3 adenylate cyclase
MTYEGIEGFLAKVGKPAMDPSLQEAPYDPIVQELWTILMWPLYCVLMEPMYAEIIDVIEEELNKTDNNMYPVIIVLLLVAIICQATSILNIRGIETHMRNVLHLLQHCPASVLMQTPRVMAVLNGDFSNRRRDETSRNAAFFESIVEQMPEAVLICSTSTRLIKSSNAACERILGGRFVGESIEELLKTRFDGDVQGLLDPSTDQRAKADNLVYRKNETDTVNVEVSMMLMADVTVYVLRDMTQTVRYNTLIAAERTKSDQILQSILPPTLVPRVQAGEKNILFAVASVSIVFIDIVSFTPWCGSSQADKVMMTLNNLFKRFDANCNSYSTMTRIKCIGDCYMGAGGVFAEINQPAEHAKQVVSFGLDCLQSIQEMNAELNEQLKIRVGVNTGGPIVAGVLGGIGSGKPTFEILGPAINMAQQMEHHGVPMQVHISRAVYELIYGGEFKVTERGTIQITQGNVVTYLVTGRIR